MITAILLAQLQLTGAPIASIGVMDGDTLQTLAKVANAIEDRRGYLYVLQIGTPYVAVFDSTGRRAATLGRAGGGPGEFGAPTRVSIVDGDSIWVSDSRLGKLSLFGPDFTHVRDVIIHAAYPALSEVIEAGRYTGISPGDVLTTGFVVEVRSSTTYYQVFQPWAREPVLLGSFGADEGRKLVTTGSRSTFIIPPLLETPYVTARYDRVVRIERRPVLRIATMDGNALPTGSAEIVIQRLPVPRGFEQSFVEEVSESLKEAAPSSSREALREALDQAISVPESSFFVLPGFFGVDGELWIQQAPPGEQRRLIAIGFDGQPKETVIIPTGRRILSVREGRAWVLEVDAQDVPYLRRYVLGG